MSGNDEIRRDANGAIDVTYYFRVGRELHGLAWQEAGKAIAAYAKKRVRALCSRFRVGRFAKPEWWEVPPTR